MKLWQKVSLICSVILVVVVAVCSALLLGMAKEKLLTSAYDRTETRQRELVNFFLKELDYYAAESDSDTVMHTLLNYCFSQAGEPTAVLIVDGKTVYSQLSFSPNDYLIPANDGQRVQYAGEINGKEYLIVGSQTRITKLSGKVCLIYLVEDISPIHESIHSMMWKFVLVGLICTVIGLGLIILLVRRSMIPLRKLQAAASSIASGNYTERAELCTQDEIGELALNFNHMAESVQRHVDELTATAKRQRLFIGAVTHEFKTPLTGILLNADTLQNTYMSEDEQAEALHNIEMQGKWLEQLVQKMLRLLTINQKISLSEISVNDLLEQVRTSIEAPLREKDIQLIVTCGAGTILGDIDLLQSAIVNLVDNAAKASERGQQVSVKAYGKVIEVSDNGKGIPTDALEHITEPFFMVDKSRSKKLGGVGLGLALVKEIVQAHNAKLEVESIEGSGTTVRIRFQQ